MTGDAASAIEAIVQYLRQGNAETASEVAEEALRKTPEHPGLVALHGISLFQLGNLSSAEARLQKALELGPATPAIYYHLGLLAEQKGAADIAANNYEKALSLDAGHYPALLNRGNCLFQQGLLSEAEKCFLAALAMSSDKRIHKNLGVIGIERNELHIAEHHFREALIAEPNWEEAQLNLSFCLLKQQRYREGWKLYEARLKADAQRRINTPDLPAWDGRSGSKVLIWTEQGIGDAVMFLSLIPEIMARSECVGVFTDKRLHSILARSFGPDLALLDADDAIDVSEIYDAQASIESCPQFFRSSPEDFIGKKSGYMAVDSQLRERFRAQFESQSTRKLKLGLSWRTINAEVGSRRTIPFKSLLGVLPSNDCHLINLQYGDIDFEIELCRRYGFHMSHPEGVDFKKDLDAFAATVAACDYVVTIDNSTAHFSGAIGIPQTVLLPYVCDWRWGVAENAIWYDRCHLARQRQRGEWSAPLDRISRDVEALLRG